MKRDRERNLTYNDIELIMIIVIGSVSKIITNILFYCMITSLRINVTKIGTKLNEGLHNFYVNYLFTSDNVYYNQKKTICVLLNNLENFIWKRAIYYIKLKNVIMISIIFSGFVIIIFLFSDTIIVHQQFAS